MIHSYGPKNECISHSVDRCSMALRANELMPIDIPKIVIRPKVFHCEPFTTSQEIIPVTCSRQKIIKNRVLLYSTMDINIVGILFLFISLSLQQSITFITQIYTEIIPRLVICKVLIKIQEFN